jgi:bacterioferritin-associated ferredoxin
MIVCSCNVFSDHQVRSVVVNEARRPRMSEVYACLGCSASAAAALKLSSGSWMKGPAPFMRTQACTNLELIQSRSHAPSLFRLEDTRKTKRKGAS